MSPTHFNPETLCSTRHVKSAESRFCCRKLERATADNLEYMTSAFPLLAPSTSPTLHTGPRGSAQLRTLLHAKRTGPPPAQHNTHGGTVGARTDLGGGQQSPCHLRFRPAHVRPATPHTQLSGPRPPWCHTAASHRLPESYFSSAEQTQKSVCPGRRRGKKKRLNIAVLQDLVFFFFFKDGGEAGQRVDSAERFHPSEQQVLLSLVMHQKQLHWF